MCVCVARLDHTTNNRGQLCDIFPYGLGEFNAFAIQNSGGSVQPELNAFKYCEITS